MENKIKNLSLLLILIFPTTIATGTFLPNLIVTLIALSFFFYLKDQNFKSHSSEIINSKFIILLIGFCLFIVFSSIASDLSLKSLESSLFYFRYIFFIIVGSYLLRSNNNSINLLSKALIISFLLVFIQALLEFSLEISLLSGNYDTFRLELFEDEAITGSFIARLAPLFLISLWVISKELKYNNILIILFIPICGFFVFISGERAAFFYYLVLIFLIFLSKIFSIQIKIFLVLLTAIIITTITLTSDDVKNRMIDSTITQMFVENTFEFKGFSDHHNSHYITALNIFKNHKIIGSGPKTFRYLCKEKKYYHNNLSCSTHPHNTYLQLLAETGVIGFLFVFIIFIFIIKKIFEILIFEKDKNKQFIELCIFVSFLISLWPFTPTNNFFGSWYNNIFYFPLIFYFLNKFQPIYLYKNDK